MTIRRLWAALALLTTLGLSAVLLAEPTTEQTFTGEYDWTNGGKGALSAEFRPDGENQWKVVFHFDFDNESNTWKGTAQGSLADASEVTGTAKWKNRNWTFQATIADGVMTGTHTELKSRGRELTTGTFEVIR